MISKGTILVAENKLALLVFSRYKLRTSWSLLVHLSSTLMKLQTPFFTMFCNTYRPCVGKLSIEFRDRTSNDANKHCRWTKGASQKNSREIASNKMRFMSTQRCIRWRNENKSEGNILV